MLSQLLAWSLFLPASPPCHCPVALDLLPCPQTPARSDPAPWASLLLPMPGHLPAWGALCAKTGGDLGIATHPSGSPRAAASQHPSPVPLPASKVPLRFSLGTGTPGKEHRQRPGQPRGVFNLILQSSSSQVYCTLGSSRVRRLGPRCCPPRGAPGVPSPCPGTPGPMAPSHPQPLAVHSSPVPAWSPATPVTVRSAPGSPLGLFLSPGHH